VLCDRFVDSTRAYQGGAGGVSDADIMALHAVGSGGLLPDRTLVLEIPLEEGARRANARGETDRMGDKGADYYARVADRFRQLASEDTASPEDVTARLISALDGLQ
jgi:dTMP kinase